LKNKTSKNIRNVLHALPIAIILVLVVLGIVNRDRLTVESLVSLVPDNKLVSALVIIALYGVKSLSVVFPMIVLNVASGILLSPMWALAVNFIGTCVMTALPYFVGRFSGAGFYEKMKTKYPKVYKTVNEGKKSTFFFSFFLRIISCLPGDIVSMFFGAMKADFARYMTGSLLGILPGTVLATFMGVGIMNPKEPTFVIALAINLTLSVISFVIHTLYQRRKKSKGKAE